LIFARLSCTLAGEGSEATAINRRETGWKLLCFRRFRLMTRRVMRHLITLPGRDET
jgi:hypothetical protein